jgi:hypothetical protein
MIAKSKDGYCSKIQQFTDADAPLRTISIRLYFLFKLELPKPTSYCLSRTSSQQIDPTVQSRYHGNNLNLIPAFQNSKIKLL